jgi:hypothetical protein
VGTSSWLVTSRMRRVQCLWCWISASPTKDFEVALTLVLMDVCIRMNYMVHLMRLMLTKYANTTQTIMIVTISFMSAVLSTSGRLHGEFVRFLFLQLLQAHRETGRFFAASGVQLAQSNNQFHYRRAAFSSQLKSKVINILAKAAALRINLNLDDTPMASKSHTHPSHSQTSRLLTSSLFLGVPVPHATQCARRRTSLSFRACSLSSHRHSYISFLLTSHVVA